jgi:hypothetical protein
LIQKKRFLQAKTRRLSSDVRETVAFDEQNPQACIWFADFVFQE